MGTVYRAHDFVDGSKVALKILASEEIRDAERFAQEAAILATLSHPAIVRYIAHGVDRRAALPGHGVARGREPGRPGRQGAPGSAPGAGRPAPDHPGADATPTSGRSSTATSSPRTFSCRAAASRRSSCSTSGWPGWRQAKRKLTQTGVFLGTPAYVAPEVVMGSRAADRRIDFYSLGCVAYRCLTGRTPFESDDVGRPAHQDHARGGALGEEARARGARRDGRPGGPPAGQKIPASAPPTGPSCWRRSTSWRSCPTCGPNTAAAGQRQPDALGEADRLPGDGGPAGRALAAARTSAHRRHRGGGPSGRGPRPSWSALEAEIVAPRWARRCTASPIGPTSSGCRRWARRATWPTARPRPRWSPAGTPPTGPSSSCRARSASPTTRWAWAA